ncbi:hypothetical protein ES703_55475 [subsurface metagenome]
MKKTILLVLVLALGLAAEVANADYTFGTPTNLGPTVNGPDDVLGVSISYDRLELYFCSNRPGGYGGYDLWMVTRPTIDDDWSAPMNLGPTVNSQSDCMAPSISADGLTLYFSDYDYGPYLHGGFGSTDTWMVTRQMIDAPWSSPANVGQPVNFSGGDICPNISADGLSLYFACGVSRGGPGWYDLWLATRATTDNEWGAPKELGPSVNSPLIDIGPSISSSGLVLFFCSTRTGGQGDYDIWMTRRVTKEHNWRPPVNLGPVVNSSAIDGLPSISANGSTLYFCSTRLGGFGERDLWQVLIEPVVDFNGDGIVNIDDLLILIDHWGTDETLCDIGPMPWGDGIVDIQDLIVLAEHLFEGIPPVEPEEVNVNEEDADSQVELEQGQILVITLESNPTTGYRWEQVETQESILEQMGEAKFKPSETGEPPLVGAGGWEIFRFKALSTGQTSLKLVYHRPWEEGVEPLKTFSLQVVVR